MTFDFACQYYWISDLHPAFQFFGSGVMDSKSIFLWSFTFQRFFSISVITALMAKAMMQMVFKENNPSNRTRRQAIEMKKSPGSDGTLCPEGSIFPGLELTIDTLEDSLIASNFDSCSNPPTL